VPFGSKENLVPSCYAKDKESTHKKEMVHPQVANGETASIWMVAANIFDKQLWTANKGWSSRLGLTGVLTTPHHKLFPCYKPFTNSSDLE
jgi:hypothetical protein